MIRVLFVDQFLFLCDALATVLKDEPDIEVVCGVTSVQGALNLTPECDVILVNAHMPHDGAMRLIRAVTDAGLRVKILVLGIKESREQVLHFIQAGADGYVLENDTVDTLLERIRGTYAGQIHVSPMIASALMSRVTSYSQLLNRVRENIGGASQLTSREQKILDLISQGMTNQQIADRLFIEVGTVKNHVHNILQKLDTSSRHDAAATWAIVKASQKFPAHFVEDHQGIAR